MITGLFDGFIFQMLLVFRPIYALRLGTSEERAIQYLTVCMLAGIPLQFLIGYLLDRVGAQAVLVLSCAVIAPALLAFTWFSDQPFAAWPILALRRRRPGTLPPPARIVPSPEGRWGSSCRRSAEEFSLSPSPPAPAGEGRPCPSRS
jgi:predicted MFS family arabinose efflux permease